MEEGYKKNQTWTCESALRYHIINLSSCEKEKCFMHLPFWQTTWWWSLYFLNPVQTHNIFTVDTCVTWILKSKAGELQLLHTSSYYESFVKYFHTYPIIPLDLWAVNELPLFCLELLKCWNLSREEASYQPSPRQMFCTCIWPLTPLAFAATRNRKFLLLFIAWIRFMWGTLRPGRGWVVAGHLCARASGVSSAMWAQLKEVHVSQRACAQHM